MDAETTLNVMFLGGPLDHAVREVPTATTGIPRRIYEGGDGFYSRANISAGRLAYWVYLYPDHAPTPNELLDAMPAHLKETLS